MESETVIPPTFFVFLLHLLLDSKKMLASTRVRRSMYSASNSSLSIEDVRREINIRISQLKPESWCQPAKKSVSQVLLVKKEVKVPEEDEEGPVTRVRKVHKALWVPLADMANKELWEIQE